MTKVERSNNVHRSVYWDPILGRDLGKSLKNFPPCFSQSSASTALPWDFYFFKLTQPLTVSWVQLLFTVNEKGGEPDDRKPYPLLYGLANPYINLKSENSQDYAQKPQRKCSFMNSASVHKFSYWRVRKNYESIICSPDSLLSRRSKAFSRLTTSCCSQKCSLAFPIGIRKELLQSYDSPGSRSPTVRTWIRIQ